MAEAGDTVFRIERRGPITIIRASQQLETLRWDLIEHAADEVITVIGFQFLAFSGWDDPPPALTLRVGDEVGLATARRALPAAPSSAWT